LGTRVLYISYDGLMEPLGRSQVLQYLRALAGRHHIVLVTFEKPADWAQTAARDALRREVAEAGIHWHPLRYHKAPSSLATAYDIAQGTVVALWLGLRHRIEVVHARSYVASVIALAVKRALGARFVFDMRGFWADERVDGGLWPRGSRMYRVAKWFERRFLTRADVVVSLTHAGAATIREFPYLAVRPPPIEVVPTCTNLRLFQPVPRDGAAPRSGFTLGYVGTVGTWYLFDPVLESFRELLALRPNARLLIVNRDEHAFIRERLSAHGIADDRVELKTVDFARVAAEMARMDAGIFYIKPVFSKLASAPTKLGELLACGIPCLSNAGVGDVQSVLEGERVGVALDALTSEAQRAGVARLVALAEEPSTRARCVEVARRLFSLERGVTAYDGIYRSLAERAA